MERKVEINIDTIIEKLLSVRGSKPGKQVNLTETEIRGLCLKSREIFFQQPILLELSAPLKICGTDSCYCRRHPRTVLRSDQTVRTRAVPTRIKLSILG